MSGPSLAFPFRVVPDDAEPFEVTATSRDLSAWERRGGGRSVGAFVDNMQLSWMEEIAHAAARRKGLFEDNLATFRETCDIDLIEDNEDDDSVGPTRSGR